MIDDVRDALRVSGTDLDTEISDLIDAAKADLALSGVQKSKIIDEDPNLSSRFAESYDSLKHHLTLSSEYGYAYD